MARVSQRFGSVSTLCGKPSSKSQLGKPCGLGCALDRARTTKTLFNQNMVGRNLQHEPHTKTEWHGQFGRRGRALSGHSGGRRRDHSHAAHSWLSRRLGQRGSIHNRSVSGFVVSSPPPPIAFLLPYLPMWPSPRLPWPPSSSVRGGGGSWSQGFRIGTGRSAGLQRRSGTCFDKRHGEKP